MTDTPLHTAATTASRGPAAGSAQYVAGLAPDSSAMEPDAAQIAVAFLQQLDPDGWHNLVALDPAGGGAPVGQTFAPGQWDEIKQFVDRWDGERGLYFSVNEPVPGAPDTKLKKHHIGSIRGVWLDLDPKKMAHDNPGEARRHFDSERERLAGTVRHICAADRPPTATHVLDSGGGFQLFWLLKEKLPAQEAAAIAEQTGAGIAAGSGGDNVANIDRIMRLPGTLNIPSANKRANGQIERTAALVGEFGTRHTLETLAAAFSTAEANSQRNAAKEARAERAISRAEHDFDPQEICAASTYGDLPAELRERFERARAADQELQRLYEHGELPRRFTDCSGSGLLFALFQRLAVSAFAFTINDAGALYWVWEHAHSKDEPVADWPAEKLERDLTRAWGNANSGRPDPRDFIEALPDPDPDRARLEDIFGTAARQASTPQALKFETLADVLARGLDDGAKPLVDGLLDQGAMSVLYGASNTGKTFVAMSLAFSVATGAVWAGQKTAAFPVVYIATEGGRGARRRLLALARETGNSDAPFHLLPTGVDLFRDGADLEPLIAGILECGHVGLVVIDTLSRALAGGDENSSVDMGRMVRNLDRIRGATGAHVMVVHHSGKNAAAGARGHSLLRAATDTEIEIADGGMTVVKQRDMDMNFKRSFTLKPTVLGLDQHGKVSSTCTVVFDSPSADRPALQEGERDIWAALTSLHDRFPETAGFSVSAMLDTGCVNSRRNDETVRSALRRMIKRNLVHSTGHGRWAILNRERAVGGMKKSGRGSFCADGAFAGGIFG